MGKIGCKEKNHLENMENKNMTVKTKKKVQLLYRMDTTVEGISELEDRVKGFSQDINQKGIRNKILEKRYGQYIQKL